MLTERRKRILEFIEKFFENYARYPTIREICSYFKLNSTNGVYEHLRALEKEGYLNRDKKKSRAIKLNYNKVFSEKFSTTGIVSAGDPMHTIIEEGEHFENMSDLVKGDFIVRIRGNSMINAGILNGDLVSVEVDREVRNNDIVVALIDGEVTIKRIRFDKDSIVLLPENPDYNPIYVKGSNFKILGKAKMLIRKLD